MSDHGEAEHSGYTQPMVPYGEQQAQNSARVRAVTAHHSTPG